MNNPSFIETQFPVSKLSKESYKDLDNAQALNLSLFRTDDEAPHEDA